MYYLKRRVFLGIIPMAWCWRRSNPRCRLLGHTPLLSCSLIRVFLGIIPMAWCWLQSNPRFWLLGHMPLLTCSLIYCWFSGLSCISMLLWNKDIPLSGTQVLSNRWQLQSCIMMYVPCFCGLKFPLFSNSRISSKLVLVLLQVKLHKDVVHFETAYVVKLHNVARLAPTQPVSFSFRWHTTSNVQILYSLCLSANIWFTCLL